MKFFFVFLLVNLSMFSQNDKVFDFNNSSSTSDLNSSFNKNGAWIVNKPVDNSIEGSVFLFSTWENTYVIESVQGKRFSINNLNYNIQTMEIETKFSKDSIFQFNKADIRFIYANNIQYELIKNELYQVLYKGEKYSLFKNFKVNLKKGVLNPLTQVTSSDSYSRSSNYFVLEVDLLEFKLKKKDITIFIRNIIELNGSYISN